ncbi:hypothetical protein T4A_5417, partial [Trichinella pseudospiralis]
LKKLQRTEKAFGSWPSVAAGVRCKRQHCFLSGSA